MSGEWGPIIPWEPGNPVPTKGLIQRLVARDGDIVDLGPFNAEAIERPWSDNIIAYRVKREPVVETKRVRVWLRPGFATSDLLGEGTIQTRDGIPDMTTLRWEDAE